MTGGAPGAEGSARPGRPGRLLLAALVVASFAIRLALLFRPLDFLDDLAIPDDAYLSLTLARNIARGLGPLYGLAPTNGFQPLYVFLMAPAFALMPADPETPVRIALAMLALFDTVALALVVRLVARRSRSSATPCLVALAWALHPYAILTALNALETSLAFAFLAALFLALDRLRDAPDSLARARVPFGFGLLLGLAALARIDSLLLAPVIAGVWLALRGRAGLAWPLVLRAGALAALGALLVCLPWLFYSWHWTRDLFPVSGRALRFLALSAVEHRPTFENLYRPMLERAAGVVLRKNALLIGLSLVLALGLVALAKRLSFRDLGPRLATLLPALAFSVLLFAAYVGLVFGPWHFARYLFPIALVPLLLFAALADAWLEALPRAAWRSGLVAALALSVVAGSVAQPAFRRMLAPRFEGTWGYRRIGLWTRDHFSPGAVVGGSQTGAIGYFADRLVVVNLDGVVNRACYDAMRAGRLLDYVREAGVRDLVWQDDIEMLARESRNAPPAPVTRVFRIGGFETWGSPWYVYRVEAP